MSLLESLEGTSPRTRRIAARAGFALAAIGALTLIASAERAPLRLLWRSPERLAVLWQCTGDPSWSLLIADACLGLGLASFLVLVIVDRPHPIGSPLSAALVWFVVVGGSLQLVRDLGVAASVLAPSLSPALGVLGPLAWLGPALAVVFVFATRRSRASEIEEHPEGATGSSVMTIAQHVLDSGPTTLVVALTLLVLVVALASRSTFVIQRIELSSQSRSDGVTPELAASIFATELRRAMDVGYTTPIHSQNVTVRELADVADWTIPGAGVSLRALVSSVLPGERVTIAITEDGAGSKVFVTTSRGIALVVDPTKPLDLALGKAARSLLAAECAGEPSEALRSACALQRLRDGDAYLDAQRPRVAEQAYRDALAFDGEGSLWSLVYVSLARLASTEGDAGGGRITENFERAERCLAAVPSRSARAPVSEALYHHWGWANLNARNWDAAREMFQRAVQANPASPNGYQDLGTWALRTGNDAAAERSFSDAIRADPAFPYAYCDRAEARRSQGRLDLALSDFGVVAGTTLCGALGRPAALRELGRLDDAEAELRALLRNPRLTAPGADPKWIWAYKDLGDLAARRGRRTVAANWFAEGERTASRLEWASPDDRREVMGGIYHDWIQVLDPKDPKREALVARREQLLAPVASPPARPPTSPAPP